MIFCDWLPSFTMFSRFIRVIAGVRAHSFVTAECYSNAWTEHIFPEVEGGGDRQ